MMHSYGALLVDCIVGNQADSSVHIECAQDCDSATLGSGGTMHVIVFIARQTIVMLSGILSFWMQVQSR